MKAIVYHKNGSGEVLELEEIEKPAPADGEVLIKVRAASVNPLDYHLLKHAFLRRVVSAAVKEKNTRPGRDVAGQVEAIGRNVTQFKPGDDVFGACSGAFAEYACARESGLAKKPAGVSFEQAASVPVAGLTAL
jgi:NADPH:quinone reductase-like Zn-dependent oxidoreductase